MLSRKSEVSSNAIGTTSEDDMNATSKMCGSAGLSDDWDCRKLGILCPGI